MSTNNVWADLPRRLTTICLGVPALWMLWGHDGWRRVFFQATHALVAWEWVQLTQQQFMFLVLSLGLVNLADDAAFLLGLVLVMALVSVTSVHPAQPDKDMTSRCLLGLVFVTVPFRAWLYVQGNGLSAVVSLLLTVWNCDTGALVAGRVCGHLLPTPAWLHRCSPNKSLVGLSGGLLCGTLTWMGLPLFWEWIYSRSLATRPRDDLLREEYYSWWLGIILSAAALLGDLWESSLKRRYAVKDSGRLLPGHGGVMDRFDSSLVAVLVYQLILKRRTG